MSNYLTTSILVTVTSTIATVFISAWAAYGLTRVKIPFGRAVSTIILGGLMLAPAVALVPLVKMFQSLGLYNTFWALLILYTAFRIPFTTFLIRAYMIDLPARSTKRRRSTAPEPRAFWRIILPMCRPIIISTISCTSCSPGTSTCSPWCSPAEPSPADPAGRSHQSDEQARHRLPRGLRRHGDRRAAGPVLFFFGQRYFVNGLADGIGK